MASFHDVLFPLDIALKSAGGPQRRTDMVTLGSGAKERNARWAHSRRRYDAGYGVKTFEALSQVVAFFEERLYGFRWRDRLTEDGVLFLELGAGADAFAAAHPKLPLIALEFERGGDGVLVTTSPEIREFLSTR